MSEYQFSIYVSCVLIVAVAAFVAMVATITRCAKKLSEDMCTPVYYKASVYHDPDNFIELTIYESGAISYAGRAERLHVSGLQEATTLGRQMFKIVSKGGKINV